MLRIFTKRPWIIAFLAGILGIALRILFLNFESHDYENFLVPWHQTLASLGWFRGLGFGFSDYTPPYLTFIALVGSIGAPLLTSVKILSLAGDIALAWGIGLLIHTGTQNRGLALVGGSITFLAPTVLLNSAAWGQSDSLYAALAVWSLVALARNRYTPAVGLLTAAMTLKLQAIFIAPVFLGFLFARRIRIRHLWPVPIIYACSVVPALLAGRPLASIFTIYFAQMVQYRALSYYLPNVYQFFEAGGGAFMGWIGIAIAGILTLGIALSTAKTLTRSALFFPSALIMVTLTATLALPFFLPHMHERYFYLAEALAIAYACIMTSRWFVPLLLIAMTSYTYLFILFLRMFPPPSFFPTAALLVAILLFRVGLDSVVMLTKTAATPTHPPRSGGG